MSTSLATLQRETQNILDSLHPIVNKPKRQPSGYVSHRTNERRPRRSNSSTNLSRTKNAYNYSVNGSSTALAADKTLDLFNLQSNSNKITLEVLDIDSPDSTPRLKMTKKQYALMEESELQALERKNLRSKELKFRTQDFKAEHIRVLLKTDVFVPGPGVTMEDIFNEKTRLNDLENSARLMRLNREEEVSTQLEVLQHTRAAILLQATFRGYLGKKKFTLTRRLRDLSESDGEWIEVRDNHSGDVWYYNKASGVSQWERPEELNDRIASKSGLKRLVDGVHKKIDMHKDLPPLDASTKGGLSAVKYAADQVVSTLNRETQDARQEEEASREVDDILGLKYLNPDINLLAPDGTFKRPQLRETIKDALLETKFDSVSTLLADINWTDRDGKNSTKLRSSSRASSVPSMQRADATRQPFISVLGSRQKKSNRLLDSRLSVERATTSHSTRDLTMRELDYPGLESTVFPTDESQATMCFGCWSAGSKKSCMLHSDGSKAKKSDTMLLCRNWDLAVIRRRYRSEEIQEIFLQRAASLKYDIRRKKFLTVVEQRHPVYRMLNTLVFRANQRSMRWTKAVHWCNSLLELLHSGHINTPKAIALGELMRTRKSEKNRAYVNALFRSIQALLPLAPITGYTYNERMGIETILLKHIDIVLQATVDIIKVGPYPVPIKLYEARVYPLTLPKTIPMPKAASVDLQSTKTDVLKCIHLSTENRASWLEILAKSTARDTINFATAQIHAITPLAGIETLRRIKEPPVCTIKFATLGRKPRPNMKDVGGLPVELLISQLVTTFIPPQYGSLIVMDKIAVSPLHSLEVSISFISLVIDPTTQKYVLRELDHIVNYRKSPTIGTTTKSEDKFFYGYNRPEQTGEIESKGFRTAASATTPPIPLTTSPQSFRPANEIASLNNPRGNVAVTTKVDGLYPFCEPSTRDNSTLDFYHLLLEGTCSASKPQVFTAISVQEPGQFLVDMRTDLPIGHLLVSIYRSWAFTQRDVYEEFKSDDGIPYWYHRKTGQTFWERPLCDDERGSSLAGATILETSHNEEPTTTHVAQEGAVRRSNQGEFRKQILTKHESIEDATKRRKSAVTSIQAAKMSGILPSVSESNEEEKQPVTKLTVPHNTESFQTMLTVSKGESTSQSLVTAKPETDRSSALVSAKENPPLQTLENDLMIATMTKSIEQLMSTNIFSNSSPQDMIQLGMGMGMAILNQQKSIAKQETALSMQVDNTYQGASHVESSFAHDESETAGKLNTGSQKHPIGASRPNLHSSLNAMLDHTEASEAQNITDAAAEHFTSMEMVREVTVANNGSETAKETLIEVLPANADESVKHELPVLVYPELSTIRADGPQAEYNLHQVAGVGESFTQLGDESNQFVSQNDSSIKLRKTVVPLPSGFYEAIVSKHIAQQATSYLPQVPNLPQTRIVGRVKPRSTSSDWQILNFDPWSAGKAPLNTLFVANLATQRGKLFGGQEEDIEKEIEEIRGEVTKDAFIALEDKDGIDQTRAVTSRAAIIASDFKKLCSLARHGKFEEVENLLNQPDWEVPINYVDDQGRSLLHIAAQNGNKRLVKLCLRRGMPINTQTLTGQTALHYAYGFGFSALGEYMIAKGGDDSIRNSDGLTCYEGLESKHVSYL